MNLRFLQERYLREMIIVLLSIYCFHNSLYLSISGIAVIFLSLETNQDTGIVPTVCVVPVLSYLLSSDEINNFHCWIHFNLKFMMCYFSIKSLPSPLTNIVNL